jgi:hypothetical protein
MKYWIALFFIAVQDADPDVALDLANWDISCCARKLEGHPDKILEFVRKEIAWIPYSGVLRGAYGALQSRSGNSVDRSLLLAELLRASGRTVRFARGKLDEAECKKRVAALVPLHNGLERAGLRSPFPELKIEPDIARLKSLLKNADLSAIDETARAVADASDHWWVQMQDGDTWIELDPSGTPPAAVKTFSDIPEEFHQRVNFQIFVETKHGEKLEESEILQVWAPADFLIWSGATLVHARRAQGASILKGIGGEEVVPVLCLGDDHFKGDGFKFEVGGGKRGEPPRGGLNNMFGSNKATTAERLVVTLAAPNGEERKIERYLFDRIGPAARAGGKSKLRDVPMTGSIPSALLDVSFIGFSSGLLNVEEFLEQIMASIETESQKDLDVSEAAIWNAQLLGRSFLIQSQAHLLRLKVVAYEAMPRVTIVSTFASPIQDGLSVGYTVDLADDRIRTIGSDPAALFDAKLRFGVGQGFLEDRFVQRIVDISLMTDVRAQGITASTDEWKLSTESKRWTVAAPNATSWWEFDPASGEIRAMADTSLHMARRNGSLTGHNRHTDPNFNDHYKVYRNHFRKYGSREAANNASHGRGRAVDPGHRPGQTPHYHNSGHGGASGNTHNQFGKAKQGPPKGYRQGQGFRKKKGNKGGAGTEYMLVISFITEGAVAAIMETYPDLLAASANAVASEVGYELLRG